MSRTAPRILSHEELQALMPWIVNGTLPEGEGEAVEAHLRACAPCRRELDAERRLHALMRQPGTVDYAPGPSLQKLLWRLDEIGADGGRPAAAATGSKTPRPARKRWPAWMLVAQAAAITLLAVAMLFQVLERTAPLYRTVTAPRNAHAALRIMFAPGTTAQDIQLMLSASDAVIVDGPSPAGIYSLDLPAGTGPAAAERVAQALRMRPQVLFVEAQPP